jgi:AraC-like DNA-binding protein
MVCRAATVAARKPEHAGGGRHRFSARPREISTAVAPPFPYRQHRQRLMENCRTHVLHRGTLATVRDVDCAERASRVGPEERASEHALVFVRAGVFVKHAPTARRDALVAEPVHALFFNAGEPYHVSHPTDDGDACTSIAYAADAVRDVVSGHEPRAADDEARPFTIPNAPVASEAMLHVRALRRALRDPGTNGLAIEEELLALLDGVLRAGRRAHGVASSARRRETRRERRELVERTKGVLAARPGERRSLPALAREVGSSPFHLTRVFRELVGMPVHQYLLRLRLTVALERLDGGDGVSTVAHAVGFSSHAHFTDAFRARFGMAPSRFVAATRRGA